MISFGDTRNNLEKLRSYLSKMQFFSQLGQKIAVKQFEESNLRAVGNQMFLPLINFILIEYSSQLYMKILDYVPNMKYQDDKSFLENSLNIARKMLNMQVSLTAQQFLTNKYFQKKLEFVASLAKSVYERGEATKKIKSKDISSRLQSLPPRNTADFDDFEDEVPIKITAKQTIINMHEFAEISHSRAKQAGKFSTRSGPQEQQKRRYSPFTIQGEQFDETEVEQALERHPTPVSTHGTRRPTETPIALPQRTVNAKKSLEQSEPLYEPQLQEDDHFYDKYRTQEMRHSEKPIKSQALAKTKPHSQPATEDTVSRQQFNELMKLVRVLSQTVTQISEKFIGLETNVSAQVASMNARVMVLEGSVRLLKENL